MNIADLTNAIIYLPEQFYKLGNVSFYSLLQSSGYFEFYEDINEEELLLGIINHPSYVEQWLRWSADKRTPSGWYFEKNEHNKYVVGYYPRTVDLPQMECNNAMEACAYFIKKEIESIRRGNR